MYDHTSPAPRNRPEGGAGSLASGQACLSAIVERIERAIDAETAAIRSDPGFDVKASNARKSRHLYELSKAFKGLKGADVPAEQHQALARLRDKLATNETVILAHLGAVNEVAAMLRGAIEHSEADGTYSDQQVGQARRE